MSFLNPVNEPVLRFKSTDAGAPQINYNARVAGDVKAVLKACLVTGYGVKASAGWSAINEVANVIEFVSPSAIMSDYRFGIDDSSVSNTIWYYHYQGVRTNPIKNNPTKAMSAGLDRTNVKNGWQLLITNQGIFFVEILYNTVVSGEMARLTYFGRTKSSIPEGSSKNMSFWCTGLASDNLFPARFFYTGKAPTDYHISLGDSTADVNFAGANLPMLEQKNTDTTPTRPSEVELVNAIYAMRSGDMICEYSGVLLKTVRSTSGFYSIYDGEFQSRPVVYFCTGYPSPAASTARSLSVGTMLYLDTWEY